MMSLSTVIAERRLTRQWHWKVIKLCEWETKCREILLSHLWVWCQIVRFKKSQRCSEPAPQSDVGAFWRSSTVTRPAGWQWLHEAGAVTELWHFKHSWCVSLLFKQPLLMKIWVIKASGGIRSCRFDGVETKQSLLSGGHNVYRSVSDVLIRHQCRLVLVSKAHYSKVVPFSNTRLTSTSLMITDQNSFVQVPTVFLTVLLQYWYRGLKILRYIKGQITRVGYNLRK